MDAAQDVAAINFIASSKPLKEALKSANLLKSLSFNTLIIGEPGTGRHTLAALMMPDAPLLHGDDPNLCQAVENSDRIVVDRFEHLENIPKFTQALKKRKTRLVAITEEGDENAQTRALFSVRIVLPPLANRLEDVKPLAEKFLEEAVTLFGDEGRGDFELDDDRLDLSRNAFSLRRSVMLQYLGSKVEKDELMAMTQSYLMRHIDEGEDIYRRHLNLYEVPLIKAGTQRFKSQLKMSQIFGLNRNTLRKKINEWKDYL